MNNLSCARAPGFEPGLKVLETSVLPLYYARRKLRATSVTANSSQHYNANIRIICKALRLKARNSRPSSYFNISVTCPAPTVRPPSRIANFNPFSIAMGAISLTIRLVLSPGITISVPAGNSTSPVTSVVRK